jgi:hypothetical protein
MDLYLLDSMAEQRIAIGAQHLGSAPVGRILRQILCWLVGWFDLVRALLPAALLKTQAAAGFTQRPSIQLLLVYGKAKQIRMALPQDAQEGRGRPSDEGSPPLALSPCAVAHGINLDPQPYIWLCKSAAASVLMAPHLWWLWLTNVFEAAVFVEGNTEDQPALLQSGDFAPRQ